MKIYDPQAKARIRAPQAAFSHDATPTKSLLVHGKMKTTPTPTHNPETNTERAPLPRLVARVAGESLSAIAVGQQRRWGEDLYVRLIDAPWRKLMAVIAIAYVSLNSLFATLYSLDPTSILNARPDSAVDAFFFSVQTFATIGYGQMAPHGIYANCLVTAEAFLGFAFYAMITGLVFAKFSRPTARIMFSNVAVICNYQGTPHLMLRLANQRLNRIINASLQAVLLIEEMTEEGQRMRRFVDVSLVRSQVPFMLLTWTAMHKIDKYSPFYGVTRNQLRDRSAELILSLTGLDESLAQTIHARYSYLADEVMFNYVFEDVITRREDGRVEIHYDKFDNVRPYSGANPAVMPGVKPNPDDFPADQLPVDLAAPAAASPEKNSRVVARAEDDAAFAEFVKMCSPD